MKISTPAGYDDPIWKQVSAIPLDYFKTSTNVAEGPDGQPDCQKTIRWTPSCPYKVMYDDTYIYYLYDVTEANYQEISSYCPAGRDWSKDEHLPGVSEAWQRGNFRPPGNLPSKNIPPGRRPLSCHAEGQP